MAEAIAHYEGFVVASVLLPRLARGARVLDFGDRAGLVGAHLQAAGLTVAKGDGAGLRFAGAFAEVASWEVVRKTAGDLADRLEAGAPVLLRMARGRGRPEALAASDLGPGFSWRVAGVLGLLVPSEDRSAWASAHPHAFGLLCAAESVVRHSFLFRGGGREVLLLGTRRTS